jgi:hypothetical protein
MLLVLVDCMKAEGVDCMKAEGGKGDADVVVAYPVVGAFAGLEVMCSDAIAVGVGP